MLKISDELIKKQYQLEMYKIKQKVRKDFFKSSLKRVIVRPFLKNKLTRRFFETFVPYSYNDIEIDTNYFSNSRIAIYTAVYGNYDEIYNPRIVPNNCDYYIFTDKKIDNNNIVWDKKEFNNEDFEKLSNAEKNRYIKMHPHILFPEYEYSIYVDGNIEIMTDFTEFIHNFNKYGVKFHNHFNRNCVYKEIDECIKQRKISIIQLNEYKEKLRSEGLPNNNGLLECPIICRKHHNSKCIEIMDKWWNEYFINIKRDQIALAYVLYKEGINTEELGGLGRDIHSNYSFIQHSHSGR